MRRSGIPIPTLDPPWPEAVKIAVIISHEAPPGWLGLAHEVAAVAQPGGHSFPLAERPACRDTTEPGRTAFLYRHADAVCGYLCLANQLVTGYRTFSAGYRRARDMERVSRPCIMVAWVDPQRRRHGVARELVEAAARHAGITASGLAWAEPFTDSGYLLAHSIAPDGLWITDYG